MSNDTVRAALARIDGADAPLRLALTAGPTVEDIDAVRFISNRSTGRMGLALAEAARERGLPTLLILGPTPLEAPAESERLAVARVRSAADMAEAVDAAIGWADALVMAAAVADYTPAAPIEGKLKKKDGDLNLVLRRTVDILAHIQNHPLRRRFTATVGHDDENARNGKDENEGNKDCAATALAQPRRDAKASPPAPEGEAPRLLRTVLGFSLGVGLDDAEGWRKLRQKSLDGIVVNTTSSFGSATETARLLRRDGSARDFGEIDKSALARALLDELRSLSAGDD